MDHTDTTSFVSSHWWKYFGSPFAPIRQSLLFEIASKLSKLWSHWQMSQFLSVLGFPSRHLFSLHQSHRLCQESSSGGMSEEGREIKDWKMTSRLSSQNGEIWILGLNSTLQISSFRIQAQIFRLQFQLWFAEAMQIRHLTDVARIHFRNECLLTSWRLLVVSHNWNSTHHCLFQFCHSLNLTMAVQLKLVNNVQCYGGQTLGWGVQPAGLTFPFYQLQLCSFHSALTIPGSGKCNGKGRQQDGGEDKNGDADRLNSLVDFFLFSF